MNPDWINGLVGGLMIGASAGLLLLGNGRIAGISGILGGLLDRSSAIAWKERAIFIGAMLASPLLYLLLFGEKSIEITSEPAMLIAAGLLVGFGARLGSGCTSGHGVCGSARLSKRSLAAMATFMGTAIGTVALVNLLG
ncbi:YeeE/YedE family protein [Rhodovulum sp. DZ06]|uniref:YeeE/YedE family protein n=1 Tax=Rhodovulum sp. DZ06 TaxID=3425126 RepID=UPI003D32871D